MRRELDWHLPPLAAEVELVIYRVAQEALTNALRHAEATEVTLSLVQERAHAVLSVRDDGRGLPPSAPSAGSSACASGRC